MTDKEIKKAVKESHQEDVVAIVLIFQDKNGYVWADSPADCRLYENCWTKKKYGTRYSYSNVIDIRVIHCEAKAKWIEETAKNMTFVNLSEVLK